MRINANLTGGNILQNVGYESLSSDPAKTGKGQIYLNTVDNKVYINSGANWQTVGVVAGLGTAGYNMADGTTTKVDKLTFISETMASIGSGLAAIQGKCGGQNSLSAGYACGGQTNQTQCGKVFFNNDTTNSTFATLTYTHDIGAGFQNIGTGMGYLAAGAYAAYWERLNFTTDIISTVANRTTRFCAAGFESDAYGYSAGGNTTLIEKLQFSTETIASISTGTTFTGTSGGGVKNPNTAGYIAGYYVGTTVCRILFSTDATITLTSGLANARCIEAGFNSRDNGYWCGGQGSGGGGYSDIQKIVFSSEAITSMSINISGTGIGNCGVENAS